MKPTHEPAIFTSLSLIAIVAICISCGGGGGGGGGSIITPPPPPPPQPLTIILTGSLPVAIAGMPYSKQFQASGGTPPYTWSTNGSPYPNPLPPGMSLSAAGLLSGTPTAVGGSGVYVQVRDSAGNTTFAFDVLRVYAPIAFDSSPIPAGNVGISYREVVYMAGGVPPFTFALDSGSAPLPAGLTMASTGVISGTPTSEGTFSFTVRVTDSYSTPEVLTGTKSVTIKNDVFVTTDYLPFAVLGHAYSLSLQVVGGTPPYSWSLSPSSTLPAGLTFDTAKGEISGTPTLAQVYYGIFITATDSSTPPKSGWKFFNDLTVLPKVNFGTSSLSDAAQNVSYSTAIYLNGGTLPYSVRIASGSLPAGTTFVPPSPTSSYAQIQGIPSALGQTSFTLEATDSSSPTDLVTQSFTLRVNPRLVFSSSNLNLPAGLEGTAYNYILMATGGLLPLTWIAPNCNTPTCQLLGGLTLDTSTGQITGIPNGSVDASLYFGVKDSSIPPQAEYGYGQLTITGLLRLTTSNLPTVATGAPLFIQLGASGGVPPYSFSLSSGTIPAGLSFSTSSGIIQGTPVNSESQTFTLKLTDSSTNFPQSILKDLTLVAAASPGRNDTIASATPLSNGTYLASISPADDASGTTKPDNDYYAVAANPGAVVSIEITAERLTPKSSPMDSVIEIVDASGTRFTTCSNWIQGGFYVSCMNDDSASSYTLDSKLFFQVPGTSGGPPVTFYVRVLDWSGMARPDFIYKITITGAN